MATHDYVIANGTGAAVRSDLNGALAAIVSNNSSATEPATMYAYQWWADTTTGLLKQRNAANSAWITIGTLASANLGLLSLAGGTMTGALAVTAGTAALPGIAVSGDLNTGITSPGADQLAISTGGTSRLAVSTTAVSSTLAVDVPLGAVGTPSLTFTGDLNTGVFSPGADTLALVTAGTNRLHITSGGLVGIGASSPIFLTDILSGTPNTGANVNNPSQLSVTGPNKTLIGGGATFFVNSNSDFAIDNGGSIALSGRNTTSSTNSVVWGVVKGAKENATSTNTAGYLAFASQNHSSGALVEAMRIDSQQRVGIGTTSAAYQLQLSTDSAGKPSSTLWTIVSDERIKEDIELADLDLCYEAIKAIPLKRYKWRDDIYTAEQVTDRRKLGWIAQDVEAIFPKAVGTHEFKYNQVFEETIIAAVEEVLDDDGNVITPAQPERIEQGDLISEDVIEDCRDLNSDQLYAAMYGAVQKLMAKVETLEASNADLLARLSALEGPTG